MSASAATLLRGLIRAYQILVSPLLGPACRFEPSCSEFARQAITRHGTRRGSLLALGRLSRCHPFADGGFDPVPEEFPWRRASRQTGPGTEPARSGA